MTRDVLAAIDGAVADWETSPDALPARLRETIQIAEDGCWIWMASKLGWGYGKVRWQGKQCRVHRLVYEMLVGPVPDGLVLDHLCRKPSCCNPDHLEPVTIAENVRRSSSPSSLNAVKTHCGNGHEFDLINTRWNADGSRSCRECHRIWAAEARRRQRARRRRR